MQTLSVNGYDMAYLEIGQGRPLVCVHGTLGDFRTWSAVLGPLSKSHRVIAVSLRHFFPEHWDGVGDDYLMAQHIADMIGFLEKLGDGPVDLMGHSRGGHIAFRVAQLRPDLLRKLVLAEPGGELDATLDPAASGPTPSAPRGADRGVGREDQGRRHRGRAKTVLRHDRGRRRLGPASRRAEAAAARQRLHPDRTGRREPKVVFEGGGAVDRNADPVHRRRRHQGKPAGRATRAIGRGSRRQDGHDRGMRSLDVRAGAAGVFRNRDGVSGRLVHDFIN